MKPAAVVFKSTGKVSVVLSGKDIPLGMGSEILLADVVKTGPNASVHLRFHDKSEVSLSSLTTVEFRDFGYSAQDASEASFAVHAFTGVARVVTGEVVRQNPGPFLLPLL